MERVENLRAVIQQVLSDYASIPYSQKGVQAQTVFDQQADHYLVLLVGREGAKRVHGCLIHLDIIDGKIWIQRDGTEDGIATALVDEGIPKEHIVLGFRSPSLRKHTGFAVA
jgi:hypothetical protein